MGPELDLASGLNTVGFFGGTGCAVVALLVVLHNCVVGRDVTRYFTLA